MKHLQTILLLATVLLVSPASAQEKADILGFAPGMTFEQANQLRNSKRLDWTLGIPPRYANKDDYYCFVEDRQISFYFSKRGARPLLMITYFLQAVGEPRDIANSISEQYQKKAIDITKRDDRIPAYQWNLPNGMTLKYLAGLGTLNLYNDAIIAADAEAVEQAEKALHPVPKL